jgi:hypothetical protein
LNEKVAAPVKKTELTAWGIRCADHATRCIRKKLALTSPKSGGRSVGIVRLRTKGHGVLFLAVTVLYDYVEQARKQRNELNYHQWLKISA